MKKIKLNRHILYKDWVENNFRVEALSNAVENDFNVLLNGEKISTCVAIVGCSIVMVEQYKYMKLAFNFTKLVGKLL